MTRAELIKGVAVFAIVIAVAWLSMPYADRYVESVAPVKAAVPTACVQADGSHRNWPWPNPPTLWPPCEPEK